MEEVPFLPPIGFVGCHRLALLGFRRWLGGFDRLCRLDCLFGVARYLRGDALAGGLDLLTQLVVLVVDGGLHDVSRLLDASLRLAVDLLTAGSDVLRYRLAASGDVLRDNLTALNCRLICLLSVDLRLGAELLRAAPSGVHLLGHHRARLDASARGVQQRNCSSHQTADDESSQFVAHSESPFRARSTAPNVMEPLYAGSPDGSPKSQVL